LITGFAPGLAGFLKAASHSRIVVCWCQGLAAAIQLARGGALATV